MTGSVSASSSWGVYDACVELIPSLVDIAVACRDHCKYWIQGHRCYYIANTYQMMIAQ